MSALLVVLFLLSLFFFVLMLLFSFFFFFFFNDTATTEIYTLSLHDALPIWPGIPGSPSRSGGVPGPAWGRIPHRVRSEEHTSELQSRLHLVCRLLLEKKKKNKDEKNINQQTTKRHKATTVKTTTVNATAQIT